MCARALRLGVSRIWPTVIKSLHAFDFLLRVLDAAKALCKHLQLEQLADGLDQTKTLTLRLLRGCPVSIDLVLMQCLSLAI